MERTALVLGNGPSIDQLDMRLLSRFETFGTNHIYKKFPVWNREVDNVVITDSHRLREIGDAYRHFKGQLYVGNECYIEPPRKSIRRLLGREFTPLRQLTKHHFPVNWLTRRVRWHRLLLSTVFSPRRFTFDLASGLNFGPSVVISAIQLAAIRGYKRILLTGVDSRYSAPTDYFAGMHSAITYVNHHFVSNPRIWMEPALVMLQVHLENLGVELIDCTPGGALRYINKGSLEQFAGPSERSPQPPALVNHE